MPSAAEFMEWLRGKRDENDRPLVSWWGLVYGAMSPTMSIGDGSFEEADRRFLSSAFLDKHFDAYSLDDQVSVVPSGKSYFWLYEEEGVPSIVFTDIANVDQFLSWDC